MNVCQCVISGEAVNIDLFSEIDCKATICKNGMNCLYFILKKDKMKKLMARERIILFQDFKNRSAFYCFLSNRGEGNAFMGRGEALFLRLLFF